MGDCSNMYGRCSDGRHGPSGRTTVRPEFWDFRWKSFLFESHVWTVRHCRSDGRTFTASNFHIRLCASGPWGWTSERLIFYMTSIRTVEFELRFLPYGWARSDGNPRCPDGCSNLPLFELGRKSEASRSLSRLDGLLRRPDRCKLEQKLLDAEEGLDGNPRRPDGWCFGLLGVRTVWHFVRMAGTMDRWASG